MKHGISLSINVKEIEKARLYQGQKGVYLNMTVFVDTDLKDQYGNNGMIIQDVSQEERSQGMKGKILGNCKVFWSDQNQQNQGNYQQPQNQGNQNYQQPQNQNQRPQQNQQNQQPQQAQQPVIDGSIPF